MKDRIEAAAHVKEARLWDRLMTLAEHGATPNGGVNRQAFSEEDAGARRLVFGWAKALGLEVLTDEIGNLFLRRPGTDPGAPPVMSGSHLDSQPLGGKFDGAYGVMAALEAIQAIQEAGVETRRSIEAVAWVNEEGSRFQPGTMGSAFFCGERRLEELLPIVDREGITIAEGRKLLLEATPEVTFRSTGFEVTAYVEAHIEQGPLLEQAAKPIGVVEGVQGLRWFGVEVLGEAAHAGTTPRALRRDAFVAATRMVSAMQDAARDEADQLRFTVGRFEVAPGSPNTVPARVFFTVDLRHPEQSAIDTMTRAIEQACADAAPCTATTERTEDVSPTRFDDAVVSEVQASSDALGYSSMRMFSGAGHDAMLMARRCPAGMIFVPCAGGVSHNEQEAAQPTDLAAGARVLASTLVTLANR